MLQTIIQFIHANKLPIFMIIGFAGFVCCLVADHIKNQELKKLIQSAPVPGDDAADKSSAGSPGDKLHERPISALSPRKRQELLSLNIAGFIMMIASLVSLFYYGYFDRYLAMIFH